MTVATLPVLQPSLPCFSAAPALGRPDPDAEAVRKRAGVEYFELAIRDILNRCDSPRMPFAWTINPYRGCEFACTYCYARYTHGFFDLENWRDFETKIFIKQAAAETLERRLRKAALHGEPIAIGTATDPYQPAERHHQVTRSILEVFTRVEGLQLSITTKSPLIVRDLDLLEELDRKHAITVHVTVTTADAALARRLEPHAPDARARLRTVAKLAGAGIATRVNCMPVLPGINDGEDRLRPLFEAVREAGAFDIMASALFLRDAAKARFLPWLAEEFPRLVPRYQALYGRRDYLREADTQALLATFRRLKLEYGFPRATPGRG
jgi:DNA repair photolyase